MSTKDPIWTEIYHVRSYEVDPRGRATLQTLCNYLQEAAGNHARSLGLSVEQLLDRNLTWVLARLHLRLERLPLWRQAVRIETWPSGTSGLYATREFLLYDEVGASLGRGTSAWLLVDVARRRPIRMPADVQALRVPPRERPLPEADARLAPPARTDRELRFRVRYADLDLNQHVNNVRYVEWGMEVLPAELLQHGSPTELDVRFRAEANYGDAVLIAAETQETDGGFHVKHQIRREEDGRELALLRTHWVRDAS